MAAICPPALTPLDCHFLSGQLITLGSNWNQGFVVALQQVFFQSRLRSPGCKLVYFWMNAGY